MLRLVDITESFSLYPRKLKKRKVRTVHKYMTMMMLLKQCWFWGMTGSRVWSNLEQVSYTCISKHICMTCTLYLWFMIIPKITNSKVLSRHALMYIVKYMHGGASASHQFQWKITFSQWRISCKLLLSICTM